MSEFIRVKDKQTEHEFSIPEGQFKESAMDLLDKPATYPSGDPLPVKHKTSVSTEAAKKSGTVPADNGQSAPKEK